VLLDHKARDHQGRFPQIRATRRSANRLGRRSWTCSSPATWGCQPALRGVPAGDHRAQAPTLDFHQRPVIPKTHYQSTQAGRSLPGAMIGDYVWVYYKSGPPLPYDRTLNSHPHSQPRNDSRPTTWRLTPTLTLGPCSRSSGSLWRCRRQHVQGRRRSPHVKQVPYLPGYFNNHDTCRLVLSLDCRPPIRRIHAFVRPNANGSISKIGIMGPPAPVRPTRRSAWIRSSTTVESPDQTREP